ncbi:MAG: RNA methyltransferase [Kiritimatiellaceae bacterium]|nr:RNA methyltransferase [Kiritimatiellaceae bacterium]
MQTITSKDNPRLKVVRALLRSKKDRQDASAFVTEGVRSLHALVDGTGRTAYQLQEIWVSADACALAAPFNVPVYCISPEWMEQLSDCQSSQGILGVVKHFPEPFNLHPERGNYLLLDAVMDPGNMGTLIRSAVAFGFNGILLHGDCVDVFNPKTVRSTMGALPFSTVWKTDETIFERLESLGYDVIATVIQEGEALPAMKFGLRNVLVIGNEAHGISAAVQARANRKMSIPMSGNVESLNAAVAGSICMFSIASSVA